MAKKKKRQQQQPTVQVSIPGRPLSQPFEGLPSRSSYSIGGFITPQQAMQQAHYHMDAYGNINVTHLRQDMPILAHPSC